jgi:hypothetical protein
MDRYRYELKNDLVDLGQAVMSRFNRRMARTSLW